MSLTRKRARALGGARLRATIAIDYGIRCRKSLCSCAVVHGTYLAICLLNFGSLSAILCFEKPLLVPNTRANSNDTNCQRTAFLDPMRLQTMYASCSVYVLLDCGHEQRVRHLHQGSRNCMFSFGMEAQTSKTNACTIMVVKITYMKHEHI